MILLLWSTTVDNVNKLVTSGGQVNYTFMFTSGTANLPLGATVQVMTNDISGAEAPKPVNPICTSSSSLGLTLQPGAGVPSSPVTNIALLAANTTWECKFLVNVTDEHKAAGQIAAFDVRLEFGSVDTTAYYVPKLSMPVVYVYTGGSLTVAPDVAVDTSGTEGITYLASKCCKHCMPWTHLL